PKKDVGGVQTINVGKMRSGQETFLPCTPHGILQMIRTIQIEPEGTYAAVIGSSNIDANPVDQLVLHEYATVTYCHSRPNKMKDITKEADILIVAVGKEHVIDASYVKEGAVVIDVGVNRTKEGTLTGDVDFEDVKQVASYITPVPKGVGPMTITMLLRNTIEAAKRIEQ